MGMRVHCFGTPLVTGWFNNEDFNKIVRPLVRVAGGSNDRL